MSNLLSILLELSKVKTITRLVKFVDPSFKVYEYARSGNSTEELINKFRNRLVEVRKVIGNVFLIEGVNFIWKCIVNGSCSPPFDSNNAHIGVGDGNVAEDPSQTGLQGTNKYYKKVDSTYPVINNNKITFRATFGGDEANFHWYEWTVANGPGDDYVNLNRKCEDLGVKSQGSTWVLEVTLSIT